MKPESPSVQFLVLKRKPSIFNTILNLVKSHNSHTMRSSHEILQTLRNPKFHCRVHNSPPFSANRTKIKPVCAFLSYCFGIHCNASHTSAPRSSKRLLSCRINLIKSLIAFPPSSLNAPRTTHHILPNWVNRMICDERIINDKSPFMQCSQLLLLSYTCAQIYSQTSYGQ